MDDQLNDITRQLAEGKLKIKAVALVTYSLENLDHSKKTLFGYALKGRTGQKGFLDTLKGEPVGRNNVLLPLDKLDELKEFFASWQVDFKVRRLVEIEE
ncbi:hypothetical protein KY320_02665 [Candidatus Woesearchaeota archaeon]|nr:hypothetical protein [Candidatus Woesearchaeota archaeon]